MAGCLLASASWTANASSEMPVVPGSQFTSLENGVPHPTFGCGGAVVVTPQPGTQFADPLGSTPDSVTSFYAKAARLHMTWVSTMDCTPTGITHQLTRSDPNPDSTAPYLSTNWSGYDISKTAEYVQAGWTIPTVANPPLGYRYSSNGYYSSTWSGIGGGLSTGNPLIQAGSDQQVSPSGAATYYFWYEVVGGANPTPDEISISSPIAHPGDDVGSAAIWIPSLNEYEFGICDFSDTSPPGGCVQFYRSCQPSDGETCAPGISVEWIEEAPKHNGVQSNVADFGVTHFYNDCWATTYTQGVPVDCNPINPVGVSPIPVWFHEFVFNCDQVLATPTALNMNHGSAFDDVYQLPDPTCNK